MNHERHRQGGPEYEAEAWRNDAPPLRREAYLPSPLRQFDAVAPNAREQSRLLHLLGLINYRILTGKKVYIEVGGIVYKTLYGGYWRSVFTGVEHYLLKCEEVSGSVWTEGSAAAAVVDLPIVYSKEGWTTRGYSVSFLLSRD